MSNHQKPYSKRILSTKVVRLLTNNANQNSAKAALERDLVRQGPRRQRGLPSTRLRRPKRSERTEAETLDDRLATVQGHSDFCVNHGRYRLKPKCCCVLRRPADPAVIIGSVILLAQHRRGSPKISGALEARFIALVDQRNLTALSVWHWLNRSGKVTLTRKPREGGSLPGRYPRLRIASSGGR